MEKNDMYANTLPSKKLIIDGITRDLPIEACIFDLIDNAIDAKYGNKQKISMSFNGYGFEIEDDGAGICYEKMKNEALRAGSVETHGEGIGAFGIGLNRALFKLGKLININSETSEERVAVEGWDITEYMKSESWNVPIVLRERQGSVGTTISIEELHDDVSTTLADVNWRQRLNVELSKRYANFLKGGVVIVVNGDRIRPTEQKFREDSGFRRPGNVFKYDSVAVEVKCGQHARHRFPNEKGYREKVNKQLTGEYGWYVFCNGRGVLLSDRSVKTGWGTVEHSQHHGFVGVASFDGPSELLPWSTDKIDVDITKPVYIEALKSMEEAFKAWRVYTGQRRKRGVVEEIGGDAEDVKGVSASGATEENSCQGGDLADVDSYGTGDGQDEPTFQVQDHPESWCYLFGQTKRSRVTFRVPDNEKKLTAVVKELQGLKVKDHPCAIMLLLRVLIEESCKLYRRKNNGKPNVPRNTSLSETVGKCLDSMITRKIITDEHEINAIRTLCSERGQKVLSIEYLQNSVHSSRSFLSAGVIRPFWNEMEAFIQGCFK